MKLRKIINRLHLWIGLASGIFIFIISISGALLVFEDDLKPFLYSDRYQVEPRGNELVPLHEMLKTAHSRFGNNKTVNAIEYTNDEKRSVRFRSYKDNENPGIWYWDEKSHYESIFINPYTGKIITRENSEFEFFRVVLYIHWSLLLTSSTGQPIVGVITIIFVCSLISGMYLWWPRNKKARRTRFSFKWNGKTGIKRKIYDLHSIMGFYVLSLALVVALIGLTWTFPSLGDAVSWLANGGQTTPAQPALHSTVSPSHLYAEDTVLNTLLKRYPQAQSYYLYLPHSPDGVINVVVADQGSRSASSIAQFDQYSGKLLKEIPFSAQSNSEKISAINYDIHLGRIIGIPSKIIAFLLAMICASLPVTGFMIWIKRKRG